MADKETKGKAKGLFKKTNSKKSTLTSQKDVPVKTVVKRQPSKTAAELAAEKARQRIQAKKVKEMAKKTHKERVAEFNDYLSKLSEHHDIPKVPIYTNNNYGPLKYHGFLFRSVLDNFVFLEFKHRANEHQITYMYHKLVKVLFPVPKARDLHFLGSLMPVYIAGASHNRGQSKSALKQDTFIVYEIKSNAGQTHRRYTEFETLQAHLFRTYPASIIPPIPLKENISDYIAKYFSGKSEVVNQRVIQQRIRALQVFLDFIEMHPILSKDPTYQTFIAPEANWISSNDNNNSLAPSPPPSTKSDADNLLQKKLSLLQISLEALERSQTKLLRGIKDSSKAYDELGNSFNAFSLDYADLGMELEKYGQNYDRLNGDSQDLICSSTNLLETIQICGQFCVSIQRAIDTLMTDEKEELHDEVKLTFSFIQKLLADAILASNKANYAFFDKSKEAIVSQ